ncbi:hypothetical protein Peur_040059 [Populus x canadensis]|jgi:hypothetical protein
MRVSSSSGVGAREGLCYVRDERKGEYSGRGKREQGGREGGTGETEGTWRELGIRNWNYPLCGATQMQSTVMT